MTQKAMRGLFALAFGLAGLWAAAAWAAQDAQPGTKVEPGTSGTSDEKLDVKLVGQLTPDDPRYPKYGQPSKLHVMKFQKDKKYIIDMKSTEFDSYLRLEDSAGK